MSCYNCVDKEDVGQCKYCLKNLCKSCCYQYKTDERIFCNEKCFQKFNGQLRDCECKGKWEV